jgi:hypothetical protein
LRAAKDIQIELRPPARGAHLPHHVGSKVKLHQQGDHTHALGDLDGFGVAAGVDGVGKV